MGEKRVIEPGKTFSHTGIYSPKKTYQMIESFMKGEGYKLKNVTHDTVVEEQSRTQKVKMTFGKTTNKYDSSEITVTCSFQQQKQLASTHDNGYEEAVVDGKLKVTIRGVGKSDKEYHVGHEGTKYLIRSVQYYFWDHFLQRYFGMKSILNQHGKDIPDVVARLYDTLYCSFNNTSYNIQTP